jgi:hypothetical protein
MTAAWLVARRTLLDRPWRSALLLLGYGAGVAIMIALLSVGDALLLEARDRNLVAGGDVVVLPEGIDPAVIKVNGVTGMFLTLPNAGFLVRDVLDGPRFAHEVSAAAPQISSRLLYVRAHGRVVTAGTSGGIPSLDVAAHAARAVTGGADSPADRRWLNPPLSALAGGLDRFHAPPPAPNGSPAAAALLRRTWVEWDYFNLVDPATHGYAYVTLIAGGNGLGGVLARVKLPHEPVRDVLIAAAPGPGDISTTAAAQHIGPARIAVDGDAYHLTVDDPHLQLNLRIRPQAGFALPATEWREGSAVTGYVVPVVRGRAGGTIRTGGLAWTLSDAPAYHDHNWGTWTGVTWDWGEASGGDGALVYASVHLPATDAAAGSGPGATLFLWARSPHSPAPGRGDAGGFLAALPVTGVSYRGWHPGPTLAGHTVRAPAAVVVRAASGSDTATVRITVWDALGSVPPGTETGGTAATAARGARTSKPVFLQLRGDAVVRGTIGGVPIAWSGPAAAETFVRP